MKIIVVAGARPNFMKIAPLMRAFGTRRQADLEVLLVHTGQHYGSQMSDEFFRELEIREPDINLGAGSGTHAEQTAKVMVAFEKACECEKPDLVIVVGDVNSTMACAISAKKLGIRVAHIEAGLRSRDRGMPEEINRLCTDAISDLLFTTDEIAGANLREEGIPEERIHFVGNTMIDTLLRHIDTARAIPLPPGVEAGRYAVLTLHRPANVDSSENLAALFCVLGEIAERIPMVFPAHPRTLRNLARLKLHPAIRVTEPMSYLPFIGLVANSRMVLTDSGGIQEETTVLGVPCLTMRDNTERPITCSVGTNTLVGTDKKKIREEAFAILNGAVRRSSIPPKWDGRAAERIVDLILPTSAKSQAA